MMCEPVECSQQSRMQCVASSDTHPRSFLKVSSGRLNPLGHRHMKHLAACNGIYLERGILAHGHVLLGFAIVRDQGKPSTLQQSRCARKALMNTKTPVFMRVSLHTSVQAGQLKSGLTGSVSHITPGLLQCSINSALQDAESALPAGLLNKNNNSMEQSHS